MFVSKETLQNSVNVTFPNPNTWKDEVFVVPFEVALTAGKNPKDAFLVKF